MAGHCTFGGNPAANCAQGKAHARSIRPQFHLLPRANWMNDPCAPRFFRGQYHMFFQYNPGAALSGRHALGARHQSRPDPLEASAASPLAHTGGRTTQLAASLAACSRRRGPQHSLHRCHQVSPQQETIRGEGVREVQCLATSTDPELRVWNKLDKPVLEGPPPGLQVTGFRDPCPWKDGDKWYMVVGSGFQQGRRRGAAVYLRGRPQLDLPASDGAGQVESGNEESTR